MLFRTKNYLPFYMPLLIGTMLVTRKPTIKDVNKVKNYLNI